MHLRRTHPLHDSGDDVNAVAVFILVAGCGLLVAVLRSRNPWLDDPDERDGERDPL